MEKTKKHNFFAEGPIAPQFIADSIGNHKRKTHVGAHQIFLGQVRADAVNDKIVSAIEFTCYRELAESTMEKIREATIVKHNLSCAHIKHSLGKVNAGELCFFVFVSSPHRKSAMRACEEMVELIKKEVPIFGKEIFEDQSQQWKINN